jgi:type II secretory pathway component GspD/PulD (secretin)
MITACISLHRRRVACSRLAACGLGLAAGAVFAQPPPPAVPPGVVPPRIAAPAPVPPEAAPPPVVLPAAGKDDGAEPLKFDNAPMDMLLDLYARLTGKTILRSPSVVGTATLRSEESVPPDEAAGLIEGYLAMSGIALVEDGKALRAVPMNTAHQEAQAIVDYESAPPAPSARGVVTRRLRLRALSAGQAAQLLDPLRHPTGTMQLLDGLNALVVTDTAPTLRKMKALLDEADKPLQETRVFELKHRHPSVLKAELEGLTGQVPPVRPAPFATPAPTPPGVIRTMPQPVVPVPAAGTDATPIRGPAAMLADDETGVLVVVSRPENFAFFEKIVQVLDRPVKAVAEPEKRGAADAGAAE